MVRAATSADIPAIVALHERCWRISYAGIADADAKFAGPREQHERRWHALLERTQVAEDDGAVAGFVVCGPARDEGAAADTGESSALYVDPERQGGGHGRGLVDAALDELCAAGCSRVTLWTFERNPASRGFYERLGFAWDGSATRDEDGPIVRYALTLPPRDPGGPGARRRR